MGGCGALFCFVCLNKRALRDEFDLEGELDDICR